MKSSGSIFTCLLAIFLVGCGDDGPPRVPLEGIISAPAIVEVLNGTISLLPDGGTKGPAANGLVRDGLFKFTTEDGPVAGTHRVLIDVEPVRGKIDVVAEQAAQQWKFEFKITVPAEAPYEYDFELVRESSDESADN